MNEQHLFILANNTLHEVVKQIKEDQLQVPLADGMSWVPNQTLKGELNIYAYENKCVPEILNGMSGHVLNAEFKEDLLQDNFQVNFAKYTQEANSAAENLEDPEKIVHISYGDFPAKSYLSDITIQRGLGAYDLATFLNIDSNMSDELVKGLWDIILPVAGQLREYGVFGPEIIVSEDESLLNRLLGLTGRQPR